MRGAPLLLIPLLMLATSLCLTAQADQAMPGTALKVLVFASAECPECDEMDMALNELQSELGPQRLSIQRITRDDPEAQTLFSRYQVTALPKYVVQDDRQKILFAMDHMIDRVQLAQEIRYQAGVLPKLEPPEAFREMVDQVMMQKKATVVLFWNIQKGTSDEFADLIVTMSKAANAPNILSFDALNPEVREWMGRMGIAEAPAYLLVTPEGYIYARSEAPARSWALQSDLASYHRRTTGDALQTILTGLTSPEPADGDIHPATMGPESENASDGMSPH